MINKKNHSLWLTPIEWLFCISNFFYFPLKSKDRLFPHYQVQVGKFHLKDQSQ